MKIGKLFIWIYTIAHAALIISWHSEAQTLVDQILITIATLLAGIVLLIWQILQTMGNGDYVRGWLLKILDTTIEIADEQNEAKRRTHYQKTPTNTSHLRIVPAAGGKDGK